MTPPEAHFRLIAYTAGRAFRPVEFTSLAGLLAAMNHLVPELASSLRALPALPGTEIVFTGVLELSEQQIRELGLKGDEAADHK
jgi:hypothetical protein